MADAKRNFWFLGINIIRKRFEQGRRPVVGHATNAPNEQPEKTCRDKYSHKIRLTAGTDKIHPVPHLPYHFLAVNLMFSEFTTIKARHFRRFNRSSPVEYCRFDVKLPAIEIGCYR